MREGAVLHSRSFNRDVAPRKKGRRFIKTREKTGERERERERERELRVSLIPGSHARRIRGNTATMHGLLSPPR